MAGKPAAGAEVFWSPEVTCGSLEPWNIHIQVESKAAETGD